MKNLAAKLSLDGVTSARIPVLSNAEPPPTAESLAKKTAEWLGEFSSLEDLQQKVQESFTSQNIPLSPEESGKVSRGLILKAMASAISHLSLAVSGRNPGFYDENSALDLIAGFESFESRIYLDQGGKPTIGFGHLLRPGEQKKFAQGMTREQGMQLLREDAADAVQAVEGLVTVPLNENQLKALTSFVFNIGGGKFSTSTLLRELNAGQYERVSTEMNRWIYVEGKVSRGLQNRREMEGILFDTPVELR